MPAPLEKGTRSLQFAVPTFGLGGLGSAQVGYWRFLSDRVNAGLVADLSLAYNRIENANQVSTQTSVSLALGPEAKLYTMAGGRSVAPFVHLGARAGYGRAWTDNGLARWNVSGTLAAGIGVDWFPTDNVSVGGHTGVAVTYLHADSGDAWNNRIAFDTSTGTLRLHIYF